MDFGWVVAPDAFEDANYLVYIYVIEPVSLVRIRSKENSAQAMVIRTRTEDKAVDNASAYEGDITIFRPSNAKVVKLIYLMIVPPIHNSAIWMPY